MDMMTKEQAEYCYKIYLRAGEPYINVTSSIVNCITEDNFCQVCLSDDTLTWLKWTSRDKYLEFLNKEHEIRKYNDSIINRAFFQKKQMPECPRQTYDPPYSSEFWFWRLFKIFDSLRQTCDIDSRWVDNTEDHCCIALANVIEQALDSKNDKNIERNEH